MGDDSVGAEGEVAKWDPEFTKQFEGLVAPVINRYFRAKVHGMESVPANGGALLVSNHSGGMFTPDVLILASAFYRKFGYSRPLYTLAHSFVLLGPVGGTLRRLGLLEASREAAARALNADAVVLVFPGGDYDAYRPTSRSGVIDFNGRIGYVRAAVEASVPIVPIVSIGAQETQLFLSRGAGLARLLGLTRQRLGILPISVGFPFGLSVLFPPNVPLPSKIVTQVLEPIDVLTQFGAEPDIAEVDKHVRAVMQAALEKLARGRRLPIVG